MPRQLLPVLLGLWCLPGALGVACRSAPPRLSWHHVARSRTAARPAPRPPRRSPPLPAVTPFPADFSLLQIELARVRRTPLGRVLLAMVVRTLGADPRWGPALRRCRVDLRRDVERLMVGGRQSGLAGSSADVVVLYGRLPSLRLAACLSRPGPAGSSSFRAFAMRGGVVLAARNVASRVRAVLRGRAASIESTPIYRRHRAPGNPRWLASLIAPSLWWGKKSRLGMLGRGLLGSALVQKVTAVTVGVASGRSSYRLRLTLFARRPADAKKLAGLLRLARRRLSRTPVGRRAAATLQVRAVGLEARLQVDVTAAQIQALGFLQRPAVLPTSPSPTPGRVRKPFRRVHPPMSP